MNKIHKRISKGFTLLEIILVIAAIGILAAIVLVAINPNRQISAGRDAVRASDINTIRKAIEQYSIDRGGIYPEGIATGVYKEICGEEINAECVDLSELVPDYIAGIPRDPNGDNYVIGINPDNNIVSIISNNAENREIGINPFTVLLAGAKDPGFDTGIPVGFSGSTNTFAIQSDEKIIVGGSFFGYQGVGANRIIRLNTDGSIDTSFNIGTGFSSSVNTLAIQNDGKIIVGGQFTTYQGVGASRIIRLNSDGSIDGSFNVEAGFNSTVRTLDIQSDGKIVVGGQFTSYQGVGANRIIRLNSDGSRDTSFNMGTGFNNTIWSFALQSDGNIVVGGDFTNYQGVGVNYIIRLNSDGSRDNSFNMGSGFAGFGGVYTLALQSDGKIVTGGAFTSYQGVGASRIIRLNSDGSRDNSFNIGSAFDTFPQTLTIQSDGKIVVGGEFTTYQGVGANKIIRLNSNGSRDNSFNVGSGFGSRVTTNIVQTDGRIVIGGNFTTYQGVGADRIIRLNSDGSRDTSFNMGSGFNSSISTLAIQSDGKILVEGWFTTYQGVGVNNIIRLNSDGSRDTSFNIGSGFNDSVNTLAMQSDGKILVGGWFTTYQGVVANRIIRLNSNGSRDTSFNMGSGFNSSISALAIQSDGKILVGGWFTTYQGVGADRIIRLNSDGSRDTSFNMGTGFNSSISALAIQTDGRIVIGGNFTTYQGVGANRIIRINSDGGIDTSFNIGTGFNSSISTLIIQSDGKILLGGQFGTYQDQPAGYLIRLGQ